jgi:hypothetical protein
MTKEQQIKIQRCIDEFYSNRPQVRDELGAALQVLYEAEPVKHGRWINDNGLYKCSSCKEYTITGWANCIPIEHMNKTMKYCNNCGARMDGGEND